MLSTTAFHGCLTPTRSRGKTGQSSAWVDWLFALYHCSTFCLVSRHRVRTGWKEHGEPVGPQSNGSRTGSITDQTKVSELRIGS